MSWDGKVGDDSEGQTRTDDNQLEGIVVYGENNGKIEEVSTIRESDKFLREFFIYSKICPTYTPKGEKAYVQNELLRINP